MAKVNVDVRYPFINTVKARQRIDEYMKQFVIDTLAIWVIHTTEVIPVWSGAARASFLKLANQAKVEIVIEPLIVAPIGSRIPLGFETSVGVVIAEARGSSALYGWDYESTLDHIGIVEDRVKFIEVGQQSIEGIVPVLPPPPIKRGRKA